MNQILFIGQFVRGLFLRVRGVVTSFQLVHQVAGANQIRRDMFVTCLVMRHICNLSCYDDRFINLSGHRTKH